ncbi:hypothetical protein RU03_03540 [Pseudomonas simiae]|nr:hypothetical protein RU03_03540 [Pseudomonas simiae]
MSACEWFQLAQNRDCLLAERNQMIRPIQFGGSEPFHLVAGNQPLACIQIDLRPLHVAQVTGPAEQQRGQFECTTNRQCAGVAVQCFEQCTEFFRIGHGSKVFHPLGWERP